MRVVCHGCGRGYDAPGELEGDVFRCRRCGKLLEVGVRGVPVPQRPIDFASSAAARRVAAMRAMRPTRGAKGCLAIIALLVVLPIIGQLLGPPPAPPVSRDKGVRPGEACVLVPPGAGALVLVSPDARYFEKCRDWLAEGTAAAAEKVAAVVGRGDAYYVRANTGCVLISGVEGSGLGGFKPLALVRIADGPHAGEEAYASPAMLLPR